MNWAYIAMVVILLTTLGVWAALVWREVRRESRQVVDQCRDYARSTAALGRATDRGRRR